MMNKHFNEAVEGDDGGLLICRGCKSRGTYTELPGGECPTPYKPDRVLLAESMAREQALQLRLNAADQRIDDLTQALERGKLWIGQFRAWYGDSGVVAEDHLMIIRTLRGLPHPSNEFDKPLNLNPEAADHFRDAAKMIGTERMPSMEYDEP